MADSLEYRVGNAARLNSPEEIDTFCLSRSPRERLIVEQWGKRLIEDLRLQGLYINQARNDPSGRW